MYQFASQQLTVSEVYKQGFAYFRITLRHVLPLILVGIICLYVAQIIIHYNGIINPARPLRETLSMLPNLSVQDVIAVIMLLSALVVNLYFVSVAMHRMYVFGGGITGTLKDSLKAVIHKMPTIIFLNIILFVMIFLGILFYVIPGVILIVFFAFCTPTVLFENKKAWSALARSCHLVWGYWWQTFAILITPWLLIVGVSLLSAQIGNLFLANAVSLLMFSVLMPLLYAFLLVQYRNLSIRKSSAGVGNAGNSSTP